MKKRFELIKIIQLILYIMITAGALAAIFLDEALYQAVGRDPSIRILCILLWLCLGLSFAGIFWDLTTHSAFKRQYRELDQAVYSDNVVGIANRFSCDALIDKYVDRELPENLSCIMLDIENIRAINDKYGHTVGNEVMRAFSDILSTAALGVCFVGRNGGSKFLAIFENSTEESISTFISRVNRLVDEGNVHGSLPHTEYRVGRADSSEDRSLSINRLIALADKRLEGRTDTASGAANRHSCDDMIAGYLDRGLPENLSCVMIELSNIRRFNEVGGHSAGNLALRRFSDVLRESADGFGFVGRNGGTRFLALFEDCDEERLKQFFAKLEAKVSKMNAKRIQTPVEYRFAWVNSSTAQADDIVQLVVLADRKLNQLTDRVSGISNRAGCDELIGKYVGRDLPDSIGCIMLNIANIREINDRSGFAAGSRVIRRFGEILAEASRDLCFVGRNGGSKFLALFEDCTQEKLDAFQQKVSEAVEAYNRSGDGKNMRFECGRAFHEEGITEINRLIALADRRASAEGREQENGKA